MGNDEVPLILWQMMMGERERHISTDPLTIGVATFDGLARTGYPYDFQTYMIGGVPTI